MKICTRYLDYVENNDVVCDAPEWTDILAHAQKCPDCSSAMRQRGEMLEMLDDMGEVAYPVDMHQRIMAEVESVSAADIETTPWYDRLLEKILRPIEIGFSFACILMIALMLNSENESFVTPASDGSKPVMIARQDVDIQPEAGTDEIEPVSQQEVKEFLARLERFNRLHQDSQEREIEPDKNYLPELRLVNDWK